MFKKMSEPAEKSENFESEIKQCFDQIDALRQQGYSTYVLSERTNAEQISLESGGQISAVESGAEISGSTYISTEAEGDEFLLAQNHPEVKRRIFDTLMSTIFTDNIKVNILSELWIPQWIEVNKKLEELKQQIDENFSYKEISEIYSKLTDFVNEIQKQELDRSDLIINVVGKFAQSLGNIYTNLLTKS